MGEIPVGSSIGSRSAFSDFIEISPPWIETVASNRLEQSYRISAGQHEHMAITKGANGRLTVAFSHDTREMRLPGWEMEAATAFLNNPAVLGFLESKGIAAQDIMKQVDRDLNGKPQTNYWLDDQASAAKPVAGQDNAVTGKPTSAGAQDLDMSALSFETVPSDRRTTKHHISAGMEHMAITRDRSGGLAVELSHNSRELRPPGWERELAAAFLANPEVLDFLDAKGIRAEDVMKQVERRPGHNALPSSLQDVRNAPPDLEPATRSHALRLPGP